MNKALKLISNNHFAYYLWISFGNLLNLSPRGQTKSRRNLNAFYVKTLKSSDSDNLAKDFYAVGSDIQTAMHTYAKKHNRKTAN